MQTDQSKLVNYIKAQVEAFLAEMEDFYPFGAAIATDGELKPLGAYLEEEELSVQALFTILEEYIAQNISSGGVRVGAIALAGIIREDGQAFDAVQVRFYEQCKEEATVNYKYLVVDGATKWL